MDALASTLSWVGTIAGGTDLPDRLRAPRAGTADHQHDLRRSTIKRGLEGHPPCRDSAGTMRVDRVRQGPGEWRLFRERWTYETNGTMGTAYTSTCGLSACFLLSDTATLQSIIRTLQPGDTLAGTT